jgi:hypothetical protein
MSSFYLSKGFWGIWMPRRKYFRLGIQAKALPLLCKIQTVFALFMKNGYHASPSHACLSQALSVAALLARAVFS